jgi:hypothetical protein
VVERDSRERSPASQEHSSAYSSSPVFWGKMSVSERQRVRHFSETSRWSVMTVNGGTLRPLAFYNQIPYLILWGIGEARHEAPD